MKNLSFYRIIVISLLLICFNSIDLFSQNNENFLVGNWIGNIEFQKKNLRLVFRINHISKDSLDAFMDSPDQGVKDIKITKILFKNDSVIIKVKSVGLSVSGILNTKDSTISGVFRQSIFNCPLILKKVINIPHINRPQEPKPPFSYKIVEVEFTNKKENIDLSGTLTIPVNTNKCPAVVLISGSGPQNRDEEILGHKPFWVIADYLTKNGIAVLRYDDRGVGKSTGNFNEATTFNFANDAESAVEYIKTISEIDTNLIGVIGHSEGGMIAPVLASRNKNVKFIVMLAGPGLIGEKLLMKQSRLILEAEGESQDRIKSTLNLNKKIYNIVIHENDNKIAGEKIKKAYERFVNKSNENKVMLNGQKDIMIQQVTSSWFRTFLQFNPKKYLIETKCPVLALNGSKDIQVPAHENLFFIKKYLNKSGNKYVTIREMEGLNHLFQHCETGSIDEYTKNEETISIDVLEIIKELIF